MQHYNTQPIEKLDHASDHSLDVHSLFDTIQGEGPLSGHPAGFIRLAGCNLQCPGCDTEYTKGRRRMTPEAIIRELTTLLSPGVKLVVITGGEPFRQSIGLLTQLLEDHGFQVQIETNGTLPPPPGLALGCVVVVSPKAGKVHPATAELANAYKYVIRQGEQNYADGLPQHQLQHSAHPQVARPPDGFPVGAVYVQPQDEQRPFQSSANLTAALASSRRFGYTFQIQLHKLIGVE